MSAQPCKACGRPALYFRRQRREGRRPALVIGADADHDLCARCYRDLRNRHMAQELKEDRSPADANLGEGIRQ